jgi:hypothetical protein
LTDYSTIKNSNYEQHTQKETADYQQARIEALEKFVQMQQDLIDALTFRNDELMFITLMQKQNTILEIFKQ